MADADLSQGQILDWTLLDDIGSDSPTAKTGQINKADWLSETLSIVTAHADANASASNFVTIKIMGCFGSDPNVSESWRLIGTLTAGGGTAVKEDVAAQSASGQNRIEVADTTDWDTGLGERLFLLDATPVNSEIVQILGWVDNDAYLCVNNLTNTHENTADLLDGLVEQTFTLPEGCQYFQVVWSNSDDDATYYVRCDYIAETDIG